MNAERQTSRFLEVEIHWNERPLHEGSPAA
jgi:hypothetical protein